MLDPVASAVDAIARGEIVIVVDDEDRENEGDLILAASKASPEKIAFMVRHTSGILCAPLSSAIAARLSLPPMVPENGDRLRTAFTVSVDYREGLTTGISAEERASTLRALANHNCVAADFVRPGHVFPLAAREGGVLLRSGHTEAAVDLMRLAGLEEVGVLAEVVNDDGTMRRLPGLLAFAREHDLRIISIDQLIEHRIGTQSMVVRIAESQVETPVGPGTAITYRTPFDATAHIAVVFGRVGGGVAVPCRIHHEQPLRDLFRPAGAMDWLDVALGEFAARGNGVLILVRDIGIAGDPGEEAGEDASTRRRRRWREVGLGAQILRDLGVSSIRLLATRRRDYVGLSGFGIGIASTELVEAWSAALPEREAMEVDVAIVGAGPAGLAAAIRLKQRAPDLAVVVLEKGAEVGAHILSGAVIDPVGIDTLLPGWRGEPSPIRQPVTADRFLWLGPEGALRLPNALMPPLMSNHGNFIASLGDVCRWLAGKAEALGVDVFPGFAASETLHDGNGAVIGVATGDMGVGRDGVPKASFQRGMALHAKYTLLAEGARGHLAKRLIARNDLAAGRSPQKYGIGLKEVWRVDPGRHRPGLVQHSFGWPLDNRTGGGSFLYHYGEDLVAVGFVVHLNYADPDLSPFEMFQAFKRHPAICDVFAGGERLSYGARAITEGGLQSVPRLVFPGGALVGCAAGFVNVPRIKGSHNAVLSGILAADAAADAIAEGRAHDELAAYEDGWRDSAIGRDLRPVRNVKPLWSRLGTVGGIALGGLDMWLNTLGLSFWTLDHGKPDHAALRPAGASRRAPGPKPDGRLTFDRLSSVFAASVGHDEDQPVHLRVRDPDLQRRSEHDVFGGPSARFCPAGVYEWVTEGEALRYQINAANCVHCKTCDIKDPNQNIDWIAPEGGSGPNYRGM